MAVAARRDTRMRVAEYRDWAAGRPDDERWELIEGVPALMSPPKGAHQRIVANLVRRLDELAERRGCGAYPGLAILSETMDDYAPFPDVVVHCGPPPPDGYASDPLLVAEVLSPSTLLIDRGRKAEFYQTVPALRYLLLVAQDRPSIEVWRRETEWVMRTLGADEAIDLPELGGSLTVSDVYARLTF